MKKIKWNNVLKITGLILVNSIIVYSLCVFISTEPNIFKWPSEGRGVYVVFVVAFTVVGLAFDSVNGWLGLKK